MEVSHVRRRLQAAIAATRQRAQEHRQAAAEAERAYAAFLQEIATPVARQVANALKVEGLSFTVSTPGQALRLASDRGRDDFIEIFLDTGSHPPQVLGRISHARGSRTIDEERPVKTGVAPDAITEDDVLEFLLDALEPWLR
jgi:hypothetical protein